MTYKPVKKKKTNLVGRPKYYGGSSNWELTNLENGKTTNYKSVKELADKNKQFSFSVWRNIISGSVSKYDKQYKIKKISV